jgi:hypothetical protein
MFNVGPWCKQCDNSAHRTRKSCSALAPHQSDWTPHSLPHCFPSTLTYPSGALLWLISFSILPCTIMLQETTLVMILFISDKDEFRFWHSKSLKYFWQQKVFSIFTNQSEWILVGNTHTKCWKIYYSPWITLSLFSSYSDRPD